MIRFENVEKRFGTRVAVAELNLEVGQEELVALLGPSGCGKSTTLKLINRLLEPTAGSVWVQGQNVASLDPIAHRRGIGYVFQRFGLFPHLSVRGNIAVVPELLGWDEALVAERVLELAELLGLAEHGLLDRAPGELSGGQQQRVGLARALAARPSIMLMDEPFGALDPVTRDQLQLHYTRLRRELKLTTVLVTHDMNEALLMADRIVVMDGGRVVQDGSPQQLMEQPATELVSQLLSMPQRQFRQLSRLRGVVAG